jgi:lysozyme family protein
LIRQNTKSRQSTNKFRKSQIRKTHARKLTTNSTECNIQNTENTETHVHKITNVPVFLYGTWI